LRRHLEIRLVGRHPQGARREPVVDRHHQQGDPVEHGRVKAQGQVAQQQQQGVLAVDPRWEQPRLRI